VGLPGTVEAVTDFWGTSHHHLLLVGLLYLVMPWPLHWTLILAVPGFVILLVTLICGATALGLLCARFRDIGTAIVSGLQFIFILTPIIWTEDEVRGAARSRRGARRLPSSPSSATTPAA
jgi:ABC-type polysaccharide/polyol phosphate export permease